MVDSSRRLLALAAFMFVVLPSVRWAGAEAGITALDFLRLDVGPRHVAMGGAATAVGADVYSQTYNPALLTSLRKSEFGAANATWLPGVSYQDLIYSQPLPSGQAFGARLQRLDYGSIDGYDATGTRLGQIKASDAQIGASYARQVSRGLSVGAGVKIAQESIDGVSERAFLADAGLTFRPKQSGRWGGLLAGLAARNLGKSVRFDRDAAPPPSELSLGLSLPMASDSVLLAADGRFPLHGAAHGNVGAEFWVAETVALRMGLEMPRDEGPGLQAGFGFRFKGVDIDYAFVPLGDLGTSHHVGLRIGFGGPAAEASRSGWQLMRQQKYDAAILKFNEAMNLDPRDLEAARGLRRAYEALQEPVK